MPSTYSPDLRLELIANGEKTGTWGTITNLNLGTLLEDSIVGVATVTTSSTAQALTVNNGAQDQSRCSTLVLNTAAGANYNVYVPPVPKLYVVRNASSAYTCTLYASTVAGNTTAAGSGITVPISTSMLVRCDGVNIVDQTNYISGALAIGGNFSVTGTATGVTPASSDNSTKFATTAFVQNIAGTSFPAGGIIMWNGSVGSIPSGWVLCNGSSGTPDLRDRFVVGAGGSYAVGATGGSANATLVSHDHTYSGNTNSAGNHRHGLNSSGGSLAALGSQTSKVAGISAGNTGQDYYTAYNGTNIMQEAGEHNHSFSGTTSANGSSATNANLPPYYALCYIMKL